MEPRYQCRVRVSFSFVILRRICCASGSMQVVGSIDTAYNSIDPAREKTRRMTLRAGTGDSRRRRYELLCMAFRRSCQSAMMPKTIRLGNRSGAIGGAP